jgi:adenylosuccinate synthase
MSEVDIIKKRLQRSIAARKEAESILESKALELYHTNEQLKELNTNLEQQVKDRTDALRASKEKYEILVEKASDFIFNIDFNGFFTYVNETGLTSMGYT